MFLCIFKKLLSNIKIYLRNLLINTKLLKQAFGVDDEDKFTVESINVVESIESIFSSLNQELNFWNFNIKRSSLVSFIINL